MNLLFQLRKKQFTLEEAFEMDDIFYTSTTSEVMPITKIDGRIIGNGKPGPITQSLQEAFNRQIPSVVTE